MAITRAQQAKQMLQNGGRIGLRFGNRGPGEASRESRDNRDRGMGMGGKQRSAPSRDAGGRDPMAQFSGGANTEGVTFMDQARRDVNPLGILTELPGAVGIVSRALTPNPFGFSRARRSFPTSVGGGGDSQAMATIPTWMQLGFSSEAEYLASLEDEEDKDKEAEEGLRLAFRADGGRIGLQEGGGIEQRLEQLGGDVTSAEKMLQGINQRLKTAESSLGSGGGGIGSLQQPQPGIIPVQQPLGQPGPFTEKLTPLGNNFPGLGIFPPTADQLQVGEMGQIPEQFREGYAEYMKGKPIPMGGQAISYVTLPGGGTVAFGDTGSAGSFRDYLKSTGFTPPMSPLLEAIQLPGIQPGAAQDLATQTGQAQQLQFNQTPPEQMVEEGNSYFTSMSPEERVRLAQSRMQQRDIKTPEELAFLNRIIKSEGMDYLREIGDFTGRPLTQLPAQGSLGIPAAGYADGGNVVGGEFDFESARQMYGLGKLVKKVTKTVKKIAKSPIGKAALLYTGAAMAGSYGSGQGLFSKGMFNPGNIGRGIFGITAKGQALRGFPKLAAQKGLLGKLGLTGGYGSLMPTALGGIVGTSIAAGLLTPEQEKKAQELAAEEGIDIEAARNSILARAQGNIREDYRALSARAEGGRIGYQEGSKEPVAKKTMPLLDMGGKEMDLREEGGFVPIGRMEKADDVPARLSKNEFVFTADAVRNAGDGDVDKGAEVMYNMMKNLEAGGEVSEESQGLEGARKMFQTSQRLEEVL